MSKKCLYHYTDYFALDGILKNAELRVNNVLNMNDAAEMRFFMQSLMSTVRNRFIEEGDEKRAYLTRSLFEAELVNEFVYSSYAACFSAYRDDASQWERYGNGGRGVCIGFDKASLRRMASGPVSLKKVYYKSNVANHALVDVFYDLIKTDDTGDEKLRHAFDEAWISSVAYKHPSFANEHEIRLVVSPIEKEYFEIEPRYHISKERIKKYYPLDLREMCRKVGVELTEIITEIIIGPESTQSAPILQDYMKDLGVGQLTDKVVLSECPLRRVIR